MDATEKALRVLEEQCVKLSLLNAQKDCSIEAIKALLRAIADRESEESE
jgi:hypothetical protein